jgi:hypothetical protein
MLQQLDLQTVGNNRLKNPLIPNDSISVYTKRREYVSTRAGEMFGVRLFGIVLFVSACFIMLFTMH